MTRPAHLPPIPTSHYVAFRVDRPTERNPAYTWTQISDGPASWADVTTAVGNDLEDVASICHPSLGFFVQHIDNGRAVDVTTEALEHVAEWLKARKYDDTDEAYAALLADPALGVM